MAKRRSIDHVIVHWVPISVIFSCLILFYFIYLFLSFSGNLNKNYKNLSWKATITDLEKTNGIVNSDSYLGLVCAKKLPTTQVKGTARIQNITRLDSSPKRTSNASSSIPDKNNEEQIIGHMNCLLTLLNTGDVTIKETLENVSSNLQESEPAISRLDSKGKKETLRECEGFHKTTFSFGNARFN